MGLYFILTTLSVPLFGFALYFARTARSLKAFNEYNERLSEGKNPFPVVVSGRDYENDYNFAVFFMGTARKTLDFMMQGEMLCFTQQFELGSDKNRTTIQKRIVVLPLNRNFGSHFVEISEQKSFSLFGTPSDIETDSIAFNDKFHVSGSDKNAVLTALAPRIQNAIVDDGLERAESVGFCTGAIIAVFSRSPFKKHEDSMDLENAQWLAHFRDVLESVPDREAHGDVFEASPVSREFLENKREETLADMRSKATKFPWLQRRPWLPMAALAISVVFFFGGPTITYFMHA